MKTHYFTKSRKAQSYILCYILWTNTQHAAPEPSCWADGKVKGHLRWYVSVSCLETELFLSLLLWLCTCQEVRWRRVYSGSGLEETTHRGKRRYHDESGPWLWQQEHKTVFSGLHGWGNREEKKQAKFYNLTVTPHPRALLSKYSPTYPYSIASWGLNAQIHEPVGIVHQLFTSS